MIRSPERPGYNFLPSVDYAKQNYFKGENMMRWIKRKRWISSIAAASVLALAGCGTGVNPTTNNTGSGSTTNTANTSANGSASTSTSSDKTVMIGYDNYFEDVDVTELWKQLLKKKGWNVTTKELSVGALFASMHKGGSNNVNVFMDVWMPHTHKVYMDKYGASLTNLGVWHKPTRIGLVVPKYVYDKGIHSISDLNSHASLFGNQIVGISSGAGEMLTMKKQVMKQYHLKLKLIQGSGPEMLAALQKAETQKKPIVVTLWSPHWIFGKYHLKYLSDPKGAFGKPGVEQVEANKAWAKKHPQFRTWMKNFKMSKDQLDSLGLLCKKDGKVKGVQEWIKKNQSVVNKWLQNS